MEISDGSAESLPAFMGYVPCRRANAENALKPGALSASAAEAFRRIHQHPLSHPVEETADARVIADERRTTRGQD